MYKFQLSNAVAPNFGLALVVAVVGAGSVPMSASGASNIDFCARTAKLQRLACVTESREETFEARARCINVSDATAREACRAQAREAIAEERSLCKDQLEARLDICELIGGDRYDPSFEPSDFVDPNLIGNGVAPSPYLPLVVGNKWVYQAEADNEEVVVTVTDKTKLIAGVTCRVVNDVVTKDGLLIEDTDDWFAQDVAGNIWYCGEEVKDFEFFEGDNPQAPELVSIDGRFKVGVDGAKPGILVLADPQVGDAYRQEVLLGEAEDVVEVVSITGSAVTPGADCDGDCLVTRDTSPLDPDSVENKFYALGVGPILEINLEDGSRLELIEFLPAAN